MKFPKKKIDNINNFYEEYTKTLSEVLHSLNLKNLSRFSDLLEKTILMNNNIFVCGNGGSAAIANH